MSNSDISYFELQAYIGATKHMGGFESTKEMIELCRISPNVHVLDVGCGVGATICHLVKAHGCRAIGVDLRESMIARANERAQREGIADRIEFRIADAQALPFEDNRFDVVLCESVATFIEDKQKVIGEYARVVKPGGYVGLNEEFWIKPPPAEIMEYTRFTWEIEPKLATLDDWRGWMQNAGLRDIVVNPHIFDARRESSQVKRYRPGDTVRMLGRTMSLYIRNPTFRRYMGERRRLPKNFFQYFGYGLFVGRK